MRHHHHGQRNRVGLCALAIVVTFTLAAVARAGGPSMDEPQHQAPPPKVNVTIEQPGPSAWEVGATILTALVGVGGLGLAAARFRRRP